MCEKDRFCRAVLETRFPGVPLYRSVNRKFSPSEVDLIAGGFPCQPSSHAGLRLGESDPRWMWPAFHRILDKLRPRWVLIENVEGLRTRGLGAVLKGLAESGYDAEWDRLSAAAFGAPHIRQRYFVVAYPQGSRSSAAVFFREQGVVGYVTDSGRDLGGWGSLANGSHPHGKRLERLGSQRKLRAIEKESALSGIGWWSVEPDVGRMAYGVSDWVDRLRALGNSCVPEKAEWIGRRIREAENAEVSV